MHEFEVFENSSIIATGGTQQINTTICFRCLYPKHKSQQSRAQDVLYNTVYVIINKFK